MNRLTRRINPFGAAMGTDPNRNYDYFWMCKKTGVWLCQSIRSNIITVMKHWYFNKHEISIIMLASSLVIFYSKRCRSDARWPDIRWTVSLLRNRKRLAHGTHFERLLSTISSWLVDWKCNRFLCNLLSFLTWFLQEAVLARKSQIKCLMTFHSAAQMWLLPWGYALEYPPDFEDLVRSTKTVYVNVVKKEKFCVKLHVFIMDARS